MLDWLKRKLSQTTRSVAERFLDVLDAVRRVWMVLTRVFDLIRAGWRRLHPVLSFLGSVVATFSLVVYNSVKALVTQIIPRAVKVAVQALDRALRTVISRAVSTLEGALNTLTRWARAAIDTARGLITSLTRWVTDRISTLWNWVTKAGAWLWDTVSHPEKLAAWVVPHLLTPITRYLIGQATGIGRWVLARSVAAALASARIVESVIVRLL